ncbi:MAG: hemolysin family protein [Dehalococcoidia bacterium]
MAQGVIFFGEPRISSARLPRVAAVLRWARTFLALLSGVAVAWLLNPLPSRSWAVIVLSVGVLLLLLLLLDELMRRLPRRFSDGAYRLVAPLLRVLDRLLGPSSRGLPAALGSETERFRGGGASQGIRGGMVLAEEEWAELEEHERRMIRAILRLEETPVSEIMIHRVDIGAVEVSTPLSEVLSQMLEWRHSRVPVYREQLDRVVGVLHISDVLRSMSQEPPPSLEEVVNPAFFVPEQQRLDRLLQEFQERHLQMAIVVDEYGGTAGLVTIEDVVEEIVGEIEDEFSTDESDMVMVGEGEAIVNARVLLDDLNRLFATQIQGEGFDTVGGIVYSALGKIPAVGDQVVTNGLKIEVLDTLGRRVRKLRVIRLEPGEGDDSAVAE